MRTAALFRCAIAALIAITQLHAQVDAADPIYAAAFLTNSSHAYLKNAFYNVSLPCPPHPSPPEMTRAAVASVEEDSLTTCTQGYDFTSIAGHTTIQFSPPDRSIYDARAGQVQTYAMVAYARDEHASSVLIALTSPKQGAVYSHNRYSHSTVTAMGLVGDYGAVYSNVLWTRLVNASLVSVQRDENGHILSARLGAAAIANGAVTGPDGISSSLLGVLPAWVDTEYEGASYNATQVYVEILNPASSTQQNLTGIVCLSDIWDDVRRECHPKTDDDSHPPMSLLVRIGIGIGAGIVALVCIVLAYRCCRRRARRNQSLDENLLAEDAYSHSAACGVSLQADATGSLQYAEQTRAASLSHSQPRGMPAAQQFILVVCTMAIAVGQVAA